ncbi:DUF3383 family protein [Salmonella enterica subsp. enterica]|nr:DUF3383 family protein [Salmonella enterica subsp. enterica]
MWPGQAEGGKIRAHVRTVFSSSKYAALSAFGRAFTVNFNGSNTTITLKFKQEPGDHLRNSDDWISGGAGCQKCNVPAYQNDNGILQQGVMSSGDFFDERRHGPRLAAEPLFRPTCITCTPAQPKCSDRDAGVTRLCPMLSSL